MSSIYRSTFLMGGLVFCLPACMAFALPLSSASPDSQSEAPTLRVSVTEVVLDVVVTDAKGDPVTQLSQKDFKVYEDGIPQSIRGFTPPSGHAMPGSAPAVNSSADLIHIGDAPVTILVLDELDTKFEDMAYARRAVERYLLQQPPRLQQPTALMVVSDTKFDVVRDYTQDRDALLHSLRRHFPSYPYRLMKGGSRGIDASERMSMAIGSLVQIAQSAMGIKGRKNVVWIGCGFAPLSSDSGSVNRKDADAVRAAFLEATRLLLQSRVTLNVIDPTLMDSAVNDTSDSDITGPQDATNSPQTASYDLFAGDFNFLNFAAATGGFAYELRNDLEPILKTLILDGSEYYTLTYSPASGDTARDRFRKIRVVVDKPGYRVTTRTGYDPVQSLPNGETPQGPPIRNLAFDLTNAALSDISYGGIAVTSRKVNKGYQLTLPTAALTPWMPPGGSRSAEVTLMLVCFARRDRVLFHRAMEVSIPLGGAQQMLTHVDVPFLPPAGAVRIRFVVRDAISGKIGTADQTP